MEIELTASKVDELVSGNAQIIKIICDENNYDEAIKIVDKSTNRK